MRWRVMIQIVAAVLLACPFLLIAACYSTLPSELPLVRRWDGTPQLLAAKSPLVAFRVPVINALTAAAAWVMARHAAQNGDTNGAMAARNLWLTLLVTAGVKSLFEGIELAAGMVPDPYRVWAGRAAFAAVAVGICVALTCLRRAWPTLRWRLYWRLSPFELTVLLGLAAAYLVFAIVPIARAAGHAA
jgi:hypothetical protein